jgi:hypothetical protein
MDIGIEVCFGKEAAGEITLLVDFKWRSGSPAHMGSWSYPGHPAEPPELEIETIFWPIERWNKEKKIMVQDHIEMPYSGLPTSVAEAIEAYIIEHYDEHYDDSHDYEDID